MRHCIAPGFNPWLDILIVFEGKYKIKLLRGVGRDVHKYTRHEKVFFMLKPDSLADDVFACIKQLGRQLLGYYDRVFVR